MWGEHRDAPWFVALVPATPLLAEVTVPVDTTQPPRSLLLQHPYHWSPPHLIQRQLLKILSPMCKRRTMSSLQSKPVHQKSGYSPLKIVKRMLLEKPNVPHVPNSLKMR